MSKKILWIIGLSSLIFLLVSCNSISQESNLSVNDAWIRPAVVGGSPSAAYMIIENSGDSEDRLLNITADFSDMLEVHETQIIDDIAHMVPQENGVEIPPNSTVELRQGSLHVMIMQVNQDLVAGEEVELILQFEQAGEIIVPASVSSDG